MVASIPEPSAVVFDLGQVLINWDPYQPFAAEMTRDEWKVRADAADFSTLNLLGDNGVPFAELAERAEAAGPEHGRFMRRYADAFPLALTGPVPGMEDIVCELRDSGVGLFGLTNWSAETYPHAAGVAPAIDLLESVVVSGAEGVAKPEPRLFRILAVRHHLDPARTVFVDDSAANVEAAAVLGFTAILFTHAPSLRVDLQRLGLLTAQ